MVKAAEATALLLWPDAAAMTLIVSVAVTEMAPVYFVDDVVGVLPSVV
jgi:hypothetical protein